MRNRLSWCAAILAAVILAGACGGDDPSPTPTPALPTGAIVATITRAVTMQDGTQSAKLAVELALTEPQRERGLMERPAIADDAGMLFIFPAETMGAFWMKNTLIPLDLLFIRADGTIAALAVDAVPLSEDPIRSGEAVKAVLEVPGGTAARLGIAVGDRVQHPSLGGP